jgi:hypothetical protein
MRFEDLDVWKHASRLCVEIYKGLKECRDSGFKDQITRTALSIPSNIAEGYERNIKNAIGPYQGPHTLNLEPWT